MTGTALTEAAEFAEIYGLEVVEMPTNVVVQRDDMNDEVYGTMAEKIEAIMKLIEDCPAQASRFWSAPSRSRNRKRWPPSSRRAGFRIMF